MVRSATFAQVADWLNSYVVKKHPDKEALRQVWMTADDPWAARVQQLAGEALQLATGFDPTPDVAKLSGPKGTVE